MTVDELKIELKQFRLSQTINKALLQTNDNYKKRIEELSSKLPNVDVQKEIIELKILLKTLDVESYVYEDIEKKTRYMKAIKLLDKIDQYLIVEHFINHAPYWKIGKQLYYSEEWVRRRMPKSLKILCDILNKFDLGSGKKRGKL